MDWTIKESGSTVPQLLNKRKHIETELNRRDLSVPVFNFDDKWTVHRVDPEHLSPSEREESIQHAGYMLANCWKWKHPSSGIKYMALKDPHGISRAVWNESPSMYRNTVPGVEQVEVSNGFLGPFNATPKRELGARFLEYMSTKSRPHYLNQGYENQMGLNPDLDLAVVSKDESGWTKNYPWDHPNTRNIEVEDSLNQKKKNADSKISNILDPIQPTLDPDVFESLDSKPRLKPHIAEWIRRHIRGVLIDAGYPNPNKSVRLFMTGSLTTYNWSENSDFDISLFVDYDHFPEFARAELISLMIREFGGLKVPGTTHELEVYVVPHGIQPEDLYKKGLRAGFNVDKMKWVSEPDKEMAENKAISIPNSLIYARMMEDKMNLMLKYDPYGAKELWGQIHDRRRRDHSKGKGDYSESNIVYKYLINRGLTPEAKYSREVISMPPAYMAPEFAQDWEQTKNKSFDMTNHMRGYDWEVIPENVKRLKKMKKFPLNKIPRIWALNGHEPDIAPAWDDNHHGMYDPGNDYIFLHPLLTPDRANEVLWHELQHAYQKQEGTFEPKNPNKHEDYWDHPVEQDARDFGGYMRQYPLVRQVPKQYDLEWFHPSYRDTPNLNIHHDIMGWRDKWL